MQLHSSFQLLAPGMAESIIDCITGSNDVFAAGVKSDSEERKRLLIPLLSVSRNFRAITHSRYCTDYQLDLEMVPDMAVFTLTSWPKSLQGIDYATNHLATSLDIQLSVWSILTGRALRPLSRTPYDGCSFPKVCNISLHLSSGDSVGAPESRSEIDLNVCAFVERLLRMAPMASDIRLGGGGISGKLSLSASQHMGKLSILLCQRYKRVVHDVDYRGNYSGRQLDMIQNLVVFEYAVMDGHEKVWRVIRQNAMTLETLVLKFFQAGDVSGLVIDECGEYVTYPRLHKLEIHQIPAWRRVCRTKKPWRYRVLRDKVARPVFPDAVPFPVLGHLYMGIDYPFKDNTVFRGNADTLVYLDVKLYPSLADVISKYEVFTAASHPRLQCVKTHGTFSSTLLDMALGIAPHAPVRMMGDAEYLLNTRGSALPLKDHPCIRVLSLPDMKPWHETVLELFGLLPNLVELCTKPVEFYSMDDSTTKSDIYNVYSDKILAGYQFRIWRFVDSKQAWRSGIVSTLWRMAKACSAFDFVSPQAGNSEIFEGNMEDMLWVRGFKQRGERLWQIITE